MGREWECRELSKPQEKLLSAKQQTAEKTTEKAGLRCVCRRCEQNTQVQIKDPRPIIPLPSLGGTFGLNGGPEAGILFLPVNYCLMKACLKKFVIFFFFTPELFFFIWKMLHTCSRRFIKWSEKIMWSERSSRLADLLPFIFSLAPCIASVCFTCCVS